MLVTGPKILKIVIGSLAANNDRGSFDTKNNAILRVFWYVMFIDCMPIFANYLQCQILIYLTTVLLLYFFLFWLVALCCSRACMHMFVCHFYCSNCRADSCRNIRDNCIDPDNEKDTDKLEQSDFTTVCKYAVIILACVNMLREVNAFLCHCHCVNAPSSYWPTSTCYMR